MKPENIKIIAAKLKKKKDAIPAMIEKYFKNPPPTQDVKPSKGDAKAGNKAGDAKGKILQFLKKHWKMITIVLIAAIAFMWAGPAVGAKFLIGPTIRQACKLVGGAKGAVLGTIAGVAGTAAAMAMGGDGDGDVDVDAGDADVDADVDADADDMEDMDADDAEAQREMDELEQQGKEAGIDVGQDMNPKPLKFNFELKNGDEMRNVGKWLNTSRGHEYIKKLMDSGYGREDIVQSLTKQTSGWKNSVLKEQFKQMVSQAVFYTKQ